MRKVSRVLGFILVGRCLFAPAGGAAEMSQLQKPESMVIRREVTLESLLKEARKKNPGLEAKKKEYEAARARVIDAWLPEDPEFGLDVEGQPDLFRFNQRMDNEWMALQKIPFPTKLFLKGVLASRDADVAYERYKEEERDLVWHIEQPYYELILSKRLLTLLEENQKILDQFTKAVQARYESMKGPQQDLLKAQIELSRNSIEIFNQRERLHVQEAHFSHLLNQSLDLLYDVHEKDGRTTLTATREDLEKKALQKRPELKALELAVERAKVSRSLETSEWLPDLTFRVEARQFREEGDIREYDSFVGVSVPVWSLIKGIGGVWKSADLEVKAAEAMFHREKNEILLAIHEAYAKVKAAENALGIYENSILPQSKLQVEVALASYEAGQVDFLTLIDAQRTQREMQVDYFKKVAEYEMGLSDLRLAVGDDLTGASHETK